MIEMEEEKELRINKNKRTLQELSDCVRKSNIRIMGVPKGGEQKKE